NTCLGRDHTLVFRILFCLGWHERDTRPRTVAANSRFCFIVFIPLSRFCSGFDWHPVCAYDCCAGLDQISPRTRHRELVSKGCHGWLLCFRTIFALSAKARAADCFDSNFIARNGRRGDACADRVIGPRPLVQHLAGSAAARATWTLSVRAAPPLCNGAGGPTRSSDSTRDLANNPVIPCSAAVSCRAHENRGGRSE